MKTIIIKHIAILFCVLNLITSILVILLSDSFNNMPQWAPGLLAIIFVLFTKGKSGIYALIKSAFFKYVNLKWYFGAFILPVLLCSISYMSISFMNSGKLLPLQFNHPLSDYVTFVIFIILGSYSEEIGWRGFLLAQFMKKFSVLKSSLWVGIFWGIWHINISCGIAVFMVYLFLVIEFSFISSWFYIKTHHNIMTTIILHTSIDLCSFLFFEKIVINKTMSEQMMLLLYGTVAVSFLPLCIWAIKNMFAFQSCTPKRKFGGIFSLILV